MLSPVTEKLIKQLKKAGLSLEDRTALVTALLDKLGAFPIGDMIITTPTGISINGRDLNPEQYIHFREQVVALKDNFARKMINEQLRYKATVIGVHESNTIDELLFAKAIIWFINEENILIEKLSTVQ